MNKKIKSIMNKYIKQEEKGRKKGHYNASELGNCYRQLFYRYHNPKPTDEDTLKIFALGHLIHGFIDELFKNSNEIEVISNEKSILLIDSISGAVLHGRLDNHLKIDGKEVVIDTKTTKKIGDWPVPNNYKYQLMFYLKAVGCENGALLYVEKNNLDTKLVEVPYEESVFQESLNRLRNIHTFMISGIVPFPEAKQGVDAWRCNYCEYKLECDEVEEHEKSKKLVTRQTKSKHGKARSEIHKKTSQKLLKKD